MIDLGNGVVIKPREIIISVGLIALMIIFGLGISNVISCRADDVNDELEMAIIIKSPEMLEYCLETKVGDTFMEGSLDAVEPITHEDIEGQYLSLNRVRQEYRMHTRVWTDSKGRTHTEHYWTWDSVKTERFHSVNVAFLGKQMDFETFQYPGAESHIATVKYASDLRYSYSGIPAHLEGSAYDDLSDGTIEKGTKFCAGDTAEELRETWIKSEKFGTVFFWAVWIGMTCVLVAVFVALDNDWLDDAE